MTQRPHARTALIASVPFSAFIGLGCGDRRDNLQESVPVVAGDSGRTGAAEPDADPRPPAARRDGADEREAEIAGFSWVSPTLAGLPRPGRSGDLASDLAFVASQDVHTLVSLTEAGLPKDTVAGHGMASQHIPVVDFQPPTQAQFDRFLALLAEAADTKTKIAVHCEAGRGRTGTMLAASFIAGGMTADEALTEIRRLRPGSVETPGQEQALAELASRLRSAHD